MIGQKLPEIIKNSRLLHIGREIRDQPLMTLNSPLKFFDLTISIEQFETFVLVWNWRVRTRNLRCLLPLSSVNQRAIDFVSVFFFFSFVQTQEEKRIFLSLACVYSLLFLAREEKKFCVCVFSVLFFRSDQPRERERGLSVCVSVFSFSSPPLPKQNSPKIYSSPLKWFQPNQPPLVTESSLFNCFPLLFVFFLFCFLLNLQLCPCYETHSKNNTKGQSGLFSFNT